LQQKLIDFSTTLEDTRKQLEDARIKKGTVETTNKRIDK